jgi:hypothetical protein
LTPIGLGGSSSLATRRLAFDVLIPQHRHGDVLALGLAVDLTPVGLGATAMTLLDADRSKQRRLQRAVGHLSRQRPAATGAPQPLQRPADSRQPTPTRRAISLSPTPAVLERSISPTRRIAISLLASAPPCKSQRSGTLIGPAEASPSRARSCPNGGRKSSRKAERHQIGVVGDIIADSRATRHCPRSRSAGALLRLRLDSV